MTPIPNADAGQTLAREVQLAIAASERLTARDLFALAADAYGGTLAQGAFMPRDSYDAAELGLHLHLLRTVGRLPPEAGACPDADPGVSATRSPRSSGSPRSCPARRAGRPSRTTTSSSRRPPPTPRSARG